jgi:hypothetical protein
MATIWVRRLERDQMSRFGTAGFNTLYLVARGSIERVEPEIRALETDPDTAAAYAQWNAGRAQFLKDLPTPGIHAHSHKWQKTYFRGQLPSGKAGTDTHETKLQARPFVDWTDRETKA